MSAPAWILRREQIERAQRVAREQVLAMREREAEAIGALLEDLTQAIAEQLDALAGPDGRVPVEALVLIEQLVTQQIEAARARWVAQLREAMEEAVRLGLGVAGITSGDAISRVLAFVQQFEAADGLALSDRLWRLSTGLQQATMDSLRAALVRGSDANRLAAELSRLGRAVPPELAAALGEDRAASLARTLRDALTGEGRTPLGNFQRLFRTEINRAHTEGFVAGLGEVEGIAGVRFTLSPLHPRFDVCDLHAGANLHGLGRGVYPLQAHPYPAHPETLSFLQPVFIDEVSEADREGQQTPFEWLSRQPRDKQDGVLGGLRKGEAFRAGQLQPDELRLPWYMIAPRLGRPA